MFAMFGRVEHSFDDENGAKDAHSELTFTCSFLANSLQHFFFNFAHYYCSFLCILVHRRRAVEEEEE